MGKSSNIGETGVSSIRVKGQRIEDLPLGLGNQAKEQLTLAQETERLNAIAEVNAQYPHQRVDYLSARINECEENKNRMRKMVSETNARIQEYHGLIMKCEVRDKMFMDLDSQRMAEEIDEAYYEKRHREIAKDWGLWDVEALKEQIELDKEALQRFEAVIAEEDKAIKEHTETITLCRERDKKLAQLGAKAEGS